MATPLIIDDNVRAAAAEAMAHAEANPISLETIQALASGAELPRHLFKEFEVPKGFRVVFSHEVHPGGLMRHMSMSSQTPGRVPHPLGVQEVMDLLGFTRPVTECHVFPEDIGPDHQAINILEPLGVADMASSKKKA